MTCVVLQLYCLPWIDKTKNAYALSTPHVVISLSHINDSLLWQLLSSLPSLSSRSLLRRHSMIEMSINTFLTLWPWLLTYELDLLTWPRYPSTRPPCQNSCLYVRLAGIVRRTFQLFWNMHIPLCLKNISCEAFTLRIGLRVVFGH